jgi:site-specific DNA-cytosine methylase
MECERLQTVPDNYTLAVTESQAKTMLGNGWTVDVIVEFFKNLNFPQKG